MTNHPRLLLVGKSGDKEIYADVADLGTAVEVTLIADYQMAQPAHFPTRPCHTGTGSAPPASIPSGSVVKLLGCEAAALVAAGVAVHADRSAQEAPTIILVGGDKGGTGKTTTSRALADYLSLLKPRLIDTQVPNGDLRGFYPEAEMLDLSVTTAQMQIFDDPTPLTIVDVGAGLLAPTLAALDRVGIIKDVRAGSIRLVLLYLLGPSVASLSEVVDANRTISGKLALFFVRNHISANQYCGWEKDPRFAEALSAMQPRMIDVPQLDEVAAETVQQRGQAFRVFVTDAANSRILRGYVASWMGSVTSEFDRAGVWAAVHG